MNRLTNLPWLRPLALAGTIAAAVFLLWRSDEPAGPASDAAALRGEAEPDGFVVNGQYRSFDDEGNLTVRFSAPRIEQFDSNDTASLTAPRAELYGGPDAEPWIVEAETGSLIGDASLVHLYTDVQIRRSSGGQDSVLTTSSLTLDNERGMIYTDAPIELRDPAGITRATGMKAWIDERILELNSKVEGRYETGN